MTNRKLFHKLLPLEKAIDLIDHTIELKPRGTESIDILNALGRVIAVDVYANIDYPPFDRSEVDGYAVRAEDTYGASEIRPIMLNVLGSVDVGEEPKYEVGPGTAIEIATGAPIPRGCNAVVMEEHTRRESMNIAVYRSVAPLENIAIAGSDIARGELVLPRGTKIGPFELGILAALGIKNIEVYLRPKIAIISVGNELVLPGNKLSYGKIYDYNGFALTAYARSLGAEADYLGIVPDDEDALKNTLITNLSRYDVIVTSGGTSAGLKDIVYRVIEALGDIIVHGLEVKPGKPTLVGIVQNKLVIGLPGFPFSAISRALTLLRYIVEKLSGIEAPEILHIIRAKAAQKIRKEVGKDLYIPVIVVNQGLELVAIPIPHRSGSITPILKANGIAVIRRGTEIIDEGAEVDVIPLSLEIPEVVFIGSHDILLPTILRHIGLTRKCRFVSVGSLAGLINVAKGYGDIAPVHLLDPETNTYNITYVKQYKDLVLVSGYRRRLVLAFRNGNPKNIKGFEDLLRDDIIMVNRNRGSGTRIYIDLMLGKIAKEMGIEFEILTQKIKGYTYEISTHTGVAAAIAQGRADVGVCIEYAARLYNLDYIPLTWEEYDFAINRHSLSLKTTIKTFIKAIKTDRIKEIIGKIPGYEAKDDIGEIIYG